MSSLRERARRTALRLALPLLVLAAGGRPICWCAVGASGPADPAEHGSSPEASVHASCHGPAAPAPDAPEGPGLDGAPASPCAPGHECCCAHLELPTAPAPETSALGQPVAAVPPLAALLPFALDDAGVRAGAIEARAPREHSPPLYVVLCTFRC